jgi:hypothetical protein
MLPFQLLAAGEAPGIFSDGFKASVNASMNQPDKEQRTRFLVEAMRHGTDSEVFHVFPVLFSADVLNAAQKAQVCTAEIRASLGNVSAFMASTEAGRQAFPQSHAAKIRSDTNRLIVCLDQYYANGKLTLPSKPSGSSIKPRPHRHSS